jgi:transcriptional regulator with XRE-family HTH domain
MDAPMAEGRTALGRLIRDVQAANRWSYADIAENAQSAGRRLSKSRVESLRNSRLPSISAKAIEALAAGLRVPADRVAMAAVETMGYSVGSAATPSVEDAIAGDPDLSEPVRRVLLAAVAAAHDGSGHGRDEADLGRGAMRAASGRSAAEEVQRRAADDPALDA